MKLTADQIIQMIVDQMNLPKVEVLERIWQLQRSFNYPLDELEHDDDPTFPKLLAQELNVDLGDPTDFLYSELIYDKDPLIVRVIPLTTVDKAKIKTTLRNLVLELEEEIRKHYAYAAKEQYSVHMPLGLSEELMFLTSAGDYFFVRNGIFFYFESYTDIIKMEPVFSDDRKEKYIEDFKSESLINSTLEEIIDQTEIYHTFTDYQIVRTSDPNKTFIPYSIVEKMPPDWAPSWGPNYEGFLRFPYITLESLITTPGVETLEIYNYWVKEIVGTEALQYCRNLKNIFILDEIRSLTDIDFPTTLSLPNLERLEFCGTGLIRDVFELSFLQHSPKLQRIYIHMFETAAAQDRAYANVKKLILPPFHNHPLLEEIDITVRNLSSIVLSPPWYCPNLRKIQIYTQNVETLDLTVVEHCSALRVLDLCANNLKSLDLSPLRHCHDLRELDLGANQIHTLDLSPLRHCVDLQTFCLSYNLLTEVDLTPLANHPALESINMEGNLLKRISLSPLLSCSNLKTINLKDNPIENLPKAILEQQDPAVLLAYDSL